MSGQVRAQPGLNVQGGHAPRKIGLAGPRAVIAGAGVRGVAKRAQSTVEACCRSQSYRARVLYYISCGRRVAVDLFTVHQNNQKRHPV